MLDISGLGAFVSSSAVSMAFSTAESCGCDE